MTDRREEWVLVPKKPTLEMSRAVREETRFCDPVGIYQKMIAAAPTHPAITHCDNCGCDWLDNGLNPIGCPYCKQSAAPNVVGMPEFDSLLDHIYEYGTAAEGMIEKANAFARAVLAKYATQQHAAVDEATCIAVYDAVSRANLTRDVKTRSRKVAVVRDALAGQQPAAVDLANMQQGLRIVEPVQNCATPPSVPQRYDIDADPDGIRADVTRCVRAAMYCGANNVNPPPEGHWLHDFWLIGRAEAHSATLAHQQGGHTDG